MGWIKGLLQLKVNGRLNWACVGAHVSKLNASLCKILNRADKSPKYWAGHAISLGWKNYEFPSLRSATDYTRVSVMNNFRSRNLNFWQGDYTYYTFHIHKSVFNMLVCVFEQRSQINKQRLDSTVICSIRITMQQTNGTGSVILACSVFEVQFAL